MEIQIFGVKKSSDTRKALRFFAERRIKTHFVDLQERAASPGELRRFAQRFGVDALVDRTCRRFAELGLGAARLSDERWLEKLAEEPMLLRMPFNNLRLATEISRKGESSFSSAMGWTTRVAWHRVVSLQQRRLPTSRFTQSRYRCLSHGMDAFRFAEPLKDFANWQKKPVAPTS